MVSERFIQIMCYLVLMLCQMSVYGFWTKYSAYHKWRLYGGSTVRTRHQYDCAWLARTTDSATVSFRADKTECRIGGDNAKLIAGEQGDVVYFASNSSSNRAMFIKGDTVYSYSFNQAFQACIELGASLMWKSEVQQMFDTTSFTSCSCGWTQEGVVQSIDGPNCNITTRAIITCGVFTAHAWCLKDV